ncbi:MAG TPA: chemotaxis response regulator protein-glutamate methylesterase [Terriglobia bacterium]|nr:chemotaxis response regulator protein-glutamate methylesterase [Terriglobia bacterium]
MRRIRILVVDDSVVVRRLLTDALAADPSLEVVGAAADGRIALARISQLNPDVVTLDVEMPEMDGLEALAAIRKSWARLPVIMFSTVTERGAAATLDALSLGANDYVTKPSNVGGATAAMARIREELIPKIKIHCGAVGGAAQVPSAIPAQASVTRSIALTAPRRGCRVEIVAIGVSTGGPNALAELIPQLPAHLPVPVVIVQHMPPIFTKFLAERLASKSQISVEEGSPNQAVEPGHAWLAPGNFHMILKREGSVVRIETHQGPPENSCRPAVDVLFRSVAASYGAGALGVVMTGMGQDGLRGCECIREQGGRVIVQDEATSVVWGMPGFVAHAGLADKVLPLGQMAEEIARRVREFRAPAPVRVAERQFELR